MQLTIDLPAEEDTKTLAARIAKHLSAPLVLGLSGEIGAGKTTLIRAMFRALGIEGSIKSPTFSLVESYQVGYLQCHHFDLYRIQDDAELEYIGFRDYFTPQSICCIEWPERVQQGIHCLDAQLLLNPQGQGRVLQITALTSRGYPLIASLTEAP